MSLAVTYQHFVQSFGDRTGASDSLLHVHAGMAILFAARLATRRSLATIVPFAVVCVGAVAKEVLDRLAYGSWRIPDAPYDIVNTLFWPLVLMVGLRWRRAHESHATGSIASRS